MYSEQERKELFPKALFLSDLVEGQTYYQVNVGRILPFIYGGQYEDNGIRINKHSIAPNGASENWYATDAGLEPYTSGYNDLNMVMATEEDANEVVNNPVYSRRNSEHLAWAGEMFDQMFNDDYLPDYEDPAYYNGEFDHGDY